MKRFFYSVMLTGLSTLSIAQTQVTITDADLTTGNYTWTSNNEYLLDGMVYLESGGVLNIQPGTVIKGLAAPSNANDMASALIITKGASINAIGSPTQPIIFTSEYDDMNLSSDLTADDKGLWGGLIILGSGTVGNGSGVGQIEGIPTTEPRGAYGGTDNSGNSGTLKYVSIRHGGAVIGANNEINGLTLGGVGSNTTLEYIEVFANVDDGIEFFGGSVNLKHAVVAFCGDDSYDWDEAWTGKAQFLFSLQGSTDGDSGFEADGANPSSATPVSNPTIYNVTFIGSGASGATAANSHAFLLRDNTNATIANSIFTDFANKAVQVQDVGGSTSDSYSRIGLTPGINLLNNIFYQIGNNTSLDGSASGIIKPTSGGDDPTAAVLTTHMSSNGNQLTSPGIISISRSTNNQLDPRPTTTAALSNLAAIPADPFFSQVNFKGAFNPENSAWVKYWTALDEYNYLAVTVGVEENQLSNLSGINTYPNPARDFSILSLNLNEATHVEVTLYNVYGNKVMNVHNGYLNSGIHEIRTAVSDLPAGSYIYRIICNDETFTRKLIIQ